MDFVSQVKKKYPYMAIEDVSSVVNKAKMFYYGLKYPCEPLLTEAEKPIEGLVAEIWIMSACDEIVERLGFSSSVGYKENGINWSFDGAQLSDRLVSLIKPTIGVIK